MSSVVGIGDDCPGSFSSIRDNVGNLLSHTLSSSLSSYINCLGSRLGLLHNVVDGVGLGDAVDTEELCLEDWVKLLGAMVHSWERFLTEGRASRNGTNRTLAVSVLRGDGESPESGQ